MSVKPIPLDHAARDVPARAQAFEDLRPGVTQRGDAGHSRDDYAFHVRRASYQQRPPFTASTWRVTYAASSDIRKETAPATSSAVPLRCMGIILRISSCGTCSLSMSVSMRPGRHAVHGDVALRELDGQGLGRTDHARFRGAVVYLPAIADETGNG